MAGFEIPNIKLQNNGTILWVPTHPVKGNVIAPNQFAVEVDRARRISSDHGGAPVHWEHAGIWVSTDVLDSVKDPVEWLKKEDKRLRRPFRDKKR